jgi:hypothetical protein
MNDGGNSLFCSSRLRTSHLVEGSPNFDLSTFVVGVRLWVLPYVTIRHLNGLPSHSDDCSVRRLHSVIAALSKNVGSETSKISATKTTATPLGFFACDPSQDDRNTSRSD